MDIYKRKSRYKIVLLLIAVVISIATFLYTNHLASQIAKEEKQKARLWAAAIEKKAKLVKYTNELFSKLSADERNKISIWAKSTSFLLEAEDEKMLSFFTEIITENKDIPVILTNETGDFIDTRNFVDFDKKRKNNINDSAFADFKKYEPIRVKYLSQYNYIYYNDSRLFSDLKNTLNDLISSFISEVVINSASAPVILTDENNKLIAFGNVDSNKLNSPEKLQTTLADFATSYQPIVVDLGDNSKKFIYYDDSPILTKLKMFPFIQLTIFGAFVLIAYLAFSTARKEEQNLVWVGMAKETAHQLGTPISSLAAWTEYLVESDQLSKDSEVYQELNKDIDRLAVIADRFSKIGAVPKLEPHNIIENLKKNMDYIQKRSSKNCSFTLNTKEEKVIVDFNPSLFDWVLENLFKNAMDAMDGVGNIIVDVNQNSNHLYIDITDTGSGIPKNKYKTIFEPGYSTKKRGWGLGLSLVKRIIENYHNGEIFVKESTIGKGTTFRIILDKNN